MTNQQIDARLSDRYLAIIMIVVAIGALWFSREISVMASIFPRTIGILVLLFSSILLVRSFVTRPRRESAEPGSVARRLGLVGVILFWSLTLKSLGFIASSLLCATALMVLAHYHAWSAKRIVIYSLVLALIIAFFYGLFAVVLNVPLPRGMLWRGY